MTIVKRGEEKRREERRGEERRDRKVGLQGNECNVHKVIEKEKREVSIIIIE